MARPLGVLIAGGWYHVMSRANGRADLFLNDDDRRGFMGMVAELPDRFRMAIHAVVLMDSHCHLLVRTPEANVSHGIR
jgi:putative transposase